MKTGRDLREVLTELKRQQEAKRDYISPASSIVMPICSAVTLTQAKLISFCSSHLPRLG